MSEKENLSKIMVRGSGFVFTSKIISKVFGIIFTVFILARLLGPELFGIYSLALSIVAIALAFTDMGINSASTRFISDSLGKNDKKMARSYFRYFLQMKFLLAFTSTVFILALSKILSFNFYDEPLLFYPLLFASFHLFISSIAGLPRTIINSTKEFKYIPILDLVKESSKVLFALPAVLLLSYNFKVPGVFVAIGFSSFLMFVFSLAIVLKKDKKLIIGKKTSIEKPRIMKYAFFVAISSVSLVIFGAIDTLMLGAFVSAEYIGYYRAALSLVLSIAALITITPLMIPVFTQIKGQRLKSGINKVLRYNLMLTIPASIGLVLIARPAVRLIYGPDYSLSVIPLYVLSFAIITSSIISLYSALFQAKEKPKVLAGFIFVALLINVVLNYILISYFLNFGPDFAILGAAIATIASRCFLALSLLLKTKKDFGIKMPFEIFAKPLLASIFMGGFLLSINFFVYLNLFWNLVIIILSILVYFTILYIIKGITEEDIKLLRFLPFFERIKKFTKFKKPLVKYSLIL